jgi:hypothetical protein
MKPLVRDEIKQQIHVIKRVTANMSGGELPQPNSGGQVNPTALTVVELARLLSAGGNRKITPEQVQADIDAGAPVGPGGKINLVHYVAWLVREVQSSGD